MTFRGRNAQNPLRRVEEKEHLYRNVQRKIKKSTKRNDVT